MLGAFSPDAFKQAHRFIHSFEYAAAQFEFARHAPPSPTFNATAFSLGFVAHLLQDYVGHHANGFLNPAEDHPLEIAVDAYEYKNRVPGFGVHSAGAEAAAFIASSTAAYNASTALTAAEAASQWSSFNLLQLAELALIYVDFSFQTDIQKYDVCKAADWPHALANLEFAQQWSANAVQIFLDSVANGALAADAIKRAQAWVEAAFAGNGGTNCKPGV